MCVCVCVCVCVCDFILFSFALVGTTRSAHESIIVRVRLGLVIVRVMLELRLVKVRLGLVRAHLSASTSLRNRISDTGGGEESRDSVLILGSSVL